MCGRSYAWARLDLRSGRRIRHPVIATLDALVFAVARDQQDDVVVAIRVPTLGGNFAEIVNLIRFKKLQAGTGRK